MNNSNIIFKSTCGQGISPPVQPIKIGSCKPLNAKNESMVVKLHPKIQCDVRNFINDVEQELGIKLDIVEGFRTFKYQDDLYAKGRTKPGKIVTKARGGYSNHNFGTAIDVFPILEDGKSHPVAAYDKINISILKKVAPIGKRHGFEWGGDWTTIVDNPHFQKMYGHSLSQLRKLYYEAGGVIANIKL